MSIAPFMLEISSWFKGFVGSLPAVLYQAVPAPNPNAGTGVPFDNLISSFVMPIVVLAADVGDTSWEQTRVLIREQCILL